MAVEVPDPYMPPKETAGDTLYAATEEALARVGCDGILRALLATPFKRRQERWLHSLALTVRWLVGNSLTLESLRDSEVFIDIVTQASQAAARTSEAEILKALRNAVANSPLPDSPDDTIQRIFIGIVDALTDWHIRLLNLLNDPQAWFRERGRRMTFDNMGSVEQVITDAFPEMQPRLDIVEKCLKDLHAHGLLTSFNFRTQMSGSGSAVSRTTEMGREFLRFIATPAGMDGPTTADNQVE